MVIYNDTTQIALFVWLFFTIAAITAALGLGLLVQDLIRSWRTRPAEPQPKFHGRLAFHH